MFSTGPLETIQDPKMIMSWIILSLLFLRARAALAGYFGHISANFVSIASLVFFSAETDLLLNSSLTAVSFSLKIASALSTTTFGRPLSVTLAKEQVTAAIVLWLGLINFTGGDR